MLDEQFELMLAAEDFGFDSVWPAEHHFREYGFCGAPALTLAAVAARTKRIRLGTGVVVLPLNHPVRIAEDYAFLDLLSNGRIDLGIGRGYQPHEYQGLGVDQPRSRDIFRESIEVLTRAWTDAGFDYDGEFYKLKGVDVRPKPVQQPHPPIWMASLSPETFEACGRHGFNLMCAPIFGFNIRNGAAQIEQYRDALRAHGRDPAHHQVAALSMTYVADSMEEALEDFRDGVLWYFQTLGKYIAPPKGQPAVPTYEFYTQIRDVLHLAEWDNIVKAGAVICGSPDDVVQQIGEMAELCGMNTYLAWTRMGGLDQKKVLRSMDLMASKVMPQLRATGVAAK
jgi:natural product biosynthesis luciferase-like monooxygenase protein